MNAMSLKKWLTEYRGLMLFIVLMICFRSAIADWNFVPTGSMEPTILPGDEVFVNKMAYDIRLPLTSISIWRLADPVAGDIVTFESEAADKRMVKRVIGVPGDQVSLFQNRLYINEQPADYIDPVETGSFIRAIEQFNQTQHTVQIERGLGGPLQSFGPVEVPQDYLLVLGDNRDHSADSRVYGLIPRQEVTGKVLRVIASLDMDDYYKPRSNRFFHPLQ